MGLIEQAEDQPIKIGLAIRRRLKYNKKKPQQINKNDRKNIGDLKFDMQDGMNVQVQKIVSEIEPETARSIVHCVRAL